MKIGRNLAWIILSLFTICLVSPGALKAESLDIKAESYILLDADSGQVLLAHDEHKKLPPASMTKLMTLILVAQDLQAGKASLTDMVITSENAWKMGGSQIWLEPGEKLSLEEMLISIAVGSANDSCVAVAEYLEGSHEAFVERMNKTAADLGLKDTHFANSHGLPAEGHYSSPHDMALLAQIALNYPKILEYSSIKEYDLRNGALKLYNTNKLLWWYQGTDGFKTGWTNEAKYCLTATVKRDGLRLIAVVMASPQARDHFRDSMMLFNYGYAKYAFKSFFDQGQVCGTVKVGKGLMDSVEVVAAADVGSICLKGEEKSISYQQNLPRYVDAPVQKNQKIGEMEIYKDQILVKKVDLLAAQQVAKAGLFKEILRLLQDITLLG
ncbi:MAG: D-alanyl-D-alanine carboxypeptidase family protein [Syntrophomonadaceae bacterium]|jgi:D-alanyl-D-alanine carboxypeptidase (penicillin-binding protein 5/6)